MSLDDLNRELYNPESEALAGRAHEQSTYDPAIGAKIAASPFDEEQQWNKVEKGMTPKGKLRLKIALAVFSVALLTALGTYGYNWWLKNAFHQDSVIISLEGPGQADSTQSVKYVIHYKNDNRVTLKNAEIDLSYAENFQPTDNVNLKNLSTTASKIFVGDISPMSEGSADLQGVFYAPKDIPVYLHAALHFTPSNGANELVQENQIGVNVTAAPVLLNISAPQQAVDGDSISYVIDYKNMDVKQMSGIQIHADFPAGFVLGTSDPEPSESGSIWYIGNLESGQSGKINIQGQIKGNQGESKEFAVSFGQMGDDGKFVVFSSQQYSTHIVSPVLAIAQSLDGKTNGVINAGEVLKYNIKFQNTGSIGLRDAIVSAKIVGNVLDFSKLNIQSGSFDATTSTITWKASDVPALAIVNPGAVGQVSFSVPVKEIIPVASALDKNFSVISVAKIDSPDIPTPIDSNKIIGSNQLELRLASKAIFNTSGYYNDPNIKNTGPIPLQTGQETTFAMHWSVTNISNDITNAMVVASLPSGVRYTGQVFPATEKITYDSRTNQLSWDVGTISAGAGIISPPREVEFQVGVTPQTNQIGSPIVLINASAFSATDPFVSQDITLTGAQKDTQLYEDPAVGVNGKVAK